MFVLGKASEAKLFGVKPPLVKVVRRAIQLTTVDFGVGQGLRTIEQQREYVAKGTSKTMQSKHLTGDAVDLWAFENGKLNLDNWDLYYEICEAMQEAALELKVNLIWGGVWDRPLSALGDPRQEVAAYTQRQRAKGNKRILLDGPHYELVG